MSHTQKIAAANLLLILPAMVLILAILQTTNGNFTYTLDDPYIHLALAKNIFNGHYGINLSEASAPSSSILWPFLLAIFYVSPKVFELAPLVLNIIFLYLTAFIFMQKMTGKIHVRVLLVFLIFLSLNIYGLVFTGMEHSLQVMLVAILAFKLIDWDTSLPFAADKLGKAAVVCVFMLPLIRYEGLAITVPCLVYLWFKKERALSMALSALTLGSVVGFSVFLSLNGLGLLPSSVIAKSAHNGLYSVVANIKSNLSIYWFLLIPLALLVRDQMRRDKALGFLIFFSTVLHFTFGQHGWYGRYEIYFLVFMFIFAYETVRKNNLPPKILVLILPLAMTHLIDPFFSTPKAASNIFYQQGKTSEIVNMLNEPVAVNDLGIVALRSNHFVLDLWGLGSLEALKNRQNGGREWISKLMEKKGVRVAAIYDDWFPEKPENWEKVGELILLERRVTAANDTVSFYATDEESKLKLREALSLFASRMQSPKLLVRLTNPS